MPSARATGASSRVLQVAHGPAGEGGGGASRPRAACSACSNRTAACHQSHTGVAPASTSRRSRYGPASPSHSTVAGVSAVTPAAASACRRASADAAWLSRAKAKRCWTLLVPMTLPATTSKWRSSAGHRLRTWPPSSPTTTVPARRLGSLCKSQAAAPPSRRPAASGSAPCRRSPLGQSAAALPRARPPSRKGPAPHTRS